MIRAAFLVGAVVAAGCAVTPRYEWHRDGATALERENDAATCRAQALAANVPLYSEIAILNACMQGKGWRLRSIPPAN